MSIRTALIALIASVPIAAPALPPPVVEQWNGRSASRESGQFQSVMLEEHNSARTLYGTPKITWNARLADDARLYAEQLAATDVLAHDLQNGVTERQGENLFLGTRGAYSYKEMAKGWIQERASFRPGRFPEISRSGDWTDVGHYTQVVWAGTREMGCAIASNPRHDYLVCRYFPAGNVDGVVMR